MSSLPLHPVSKPEYEATHCWRVKFLPRSQAHVVPCRGWDGVLQNLSDRGNDLLEKLDDVASGTGQLVDDVRGEGGGVLTDLASGIGSPLGGIWAKY